MSDSIFVQLRINPKEAVWQDMAACKNNEMHINNFFENYERSESVAKAIDAMCSICPVKNECLNEGIETNGIGVWGGVYLNKGHYDPVRNSHKPKDEQLFLEDYVG